MCTQHATATFPIRPETARMQRANANVGRSIRHRIATVATMVTSAIRTVSRASATRKERTGIIARRSMDLALANRTTRATTATFARKATTSSRSV